MKEYRHRDRHIIPHGPVLLPAVAVQDTVSVPVRAGDFVEFYSYARIEADGSRPPVLVQSAGANFFVIAG